MWDCNKDMRNVVFGVVWCGLNKSNPTTMQQKTITLYEYSELSPEAKKRAHETYVNSSFDDYALQVHLDNFIEELLEKNGIVPVSTADKKYASTHAKIYYSLSHSQGDGAMFEGTFTWKKWTVNIKQSGHYYHSNSKVIELSNDNGDEPTEKDEEAFEKVYQAICKELEREGYSQIEDLQSEAYFIEECNANEWTFREDGTQEQL
jgi:hypothetical protein